MLKLILVSVIWETRDVHIYASCPSGPRTCGKSSDDFQSLNIELGVTVVAFWVVGIIEFVLYFKAHSIFNNQANLLAIFVHFFSILMLLNFKNTAGTVGEFLWCLVLAG